MNPVNPVNPAPGATHGEHAPRDPEAERRWYVVHLLADAERFAAAVRRGPLDATVAACPGWDLRALTVHMGLIHRWARHCAANAARPESTDQFEPADELDGDALAAWLLGGAAELTDVLGTIDLDGPTWHPFTVPRVGRVWPRRQAHESSIHRWDAELAAGLEPATIDPELASDGIDEYFEITVPRLVKRDRIGLPTGTLHVHCTDTHGEWLLTTDPEYTMVRAHQKGDAALRGPAEAILLRLWNRESPRFHELSPVGDELVLDAWMLLTGV